MQQGEFMFKSKKLEQLEQEVEDLHRRLAEKDQEIAKQKSLLLAKQRECESLQKAYTAMCEQVLQTKESKLENNAVFDFAVKHAEHKDEKNKTQQSNLTR